MTRRQGKLFDPPARPHRMMMHVVDAGQYPDGRMAAHFVCRRCGHDAGWLAVVNVTTAKRGEPCPVCNSSGETS